MLFVFTLLYFRANGSSAATEPWRAGLLSRSPWEAFFTAPWPLLC